MNFDHTDDRRMLGDTLQRFVAENAGPLIRAQAAKSPPGYSRNLWKQFGDLGVIGALLSEKHGGYGGGGFDLMVIFEALGAGQVAEPFLSALMSGQVLAGARSHDGELAALIAGDTVIAFAHQEGSGDYNPAHLATRATTRADSIILNGHKTVIHDAEGADELIVSACMEGDTAPSLFLVPGSSQGVQIKGYACIDGGRAAEITFDNVTLPTTALIGARATGDTLIADATAAGLVALCAEALGAMSVVRDATLEYLRTRVQFGQAIGRNQALQHRMASILIEIEQARSAVINAAAAYDGPSDQRDLALSAVKYTIGKTGTMVAEEAIQLHGGIGMTWELAMTHYAKRLMMINHQLGDEDYHLMRYVQLGKAA